MPSATQPDHGSPAGCRSRHCLRTRRRLPAWRSKSVAGRPPQGRIEGQSPSLERSRGRSRSCACLHTGLGALGGWTWRRGLTLTTEPRHQIIHPRRARLARELQILLFAICRPGQAQCPGFSVRRASPSRGPSTPQFGLRSQNCLGLESAGLEALQVSRHRRSRRAAATSGTSSEAFSPERTRRAAALQPSQGR